MRRHLILVLILSFMQMSAAPTASYSQDWKGKVPTGELEEERLYFTLLAAAERALLYFPDVASKEDAYQRIVRTLGKG